MIPLHVRTCVTYGTGNGVGGSLPFGGISRSSRVVRPRGGGQTPLTLTLTLTQQCEHNSTQEAGSREEGKQF